MDILKGLTGLLTLSLVTLATSFAPAQQPNSAASRLRPIGSPSAVDHYRQKATNRYGANQNKFRETAYQSRVSGNVQPTAMQFEVPGNAGTFAPPSASPLNQSSVAPIPSGTIPSQNIPGQPSTLPAPAALPRPGGSLGSVNPSPSDYAPLTAPVLSNQFATINNCAAVSGPSNYTAACGSGCAPVNYQATAPFQAPPAQIAAPVLLPNSPGFAAPTPGVAPIGGSAALNPAPVGSLLTFGQERFPVQVGQGILGQPTAYVPGQTLRNWLRYLTP